MVPLIDMSFRGSEASRGIFPSCRFYLVLVILAIWENPSTPFHFGRDDISIGNTIQPHRLYSERGGRQIAAPTVTLVGGFYHPHRLYSKCGLVVLRAANQNLLIAGGNHTMIPPMNHRRYIAWFHSSARVIFAASPERHIGRSLRFCWWVILFNRMGCIRNVAWR